MGTLLIMVKPGCFCQVVTLCMKVILHSREELKGREKRLGFETVAIGRVECGKDKGERKNTAGCQTLGRVYAISSSLPPCS